MKMVKRSMLLRERLRCLDYDKLTRSSAVSGRKVI
jgi:hypothetical protein